jgi:MFS family permease
VGAVVLLLPLVRPGQAEEAGGYAFNRKDLIANMRQPVILALLGVSLLLYSSFAALFYYVQDFAKGMSIALPGLFFTLATAAEIATRLGLGPFLDKLGKKSGLLMALGILAAGYLVLPLAGGAWLFFGLAVVFGLAWGVAAPVISALIFDASEPRFRALNTNLGFEMMQGGYFVGPLLGGMLLDDWGYGVLFSACGGACLMSLGLAASLRNN